MKADKTRTAQCPRCESVFRVQLWHLVAAKGWLQCGVCRNVFYVPQAVTKPTAPTVKKSAATQSVKKTTASGAATPTATSMVGTPSARVVAKAFSQAELPKSNPSDLLNKVGAIQGKAARQSVSHTELTRKSNIFIDSDLAVDGSRSLPTSKGRNHGPSSPQPALSKRLTTTRQWEPRQAIATPIASRKDHAPVWTLAAFILAFALASQLVYFLRDDLAAQFPKLRPLLTELCHMLDCRLALPRDTKQVRILGSDLQKENPNSLILAVTLVNRATHAVAWPVMELTLTDIQEQPVGRRIFAPDEYLHSPEMVSSGMPPLSEVPLTLKLQTQSLKAVGYRLQIF